MSTINASQITSFLFVYSTVFSAADQRKHQSSPSLAFVRRIHLWSANSPQRASNAEIFAFNDVIMSLWVENQSWPVNSNRATSHDFSWWLSWLKKLNCCCTIKASLFKSSDNKTPVDDLYLIFKWVADTSLYGRMPGGRLNKKDGLTRYGDSHVKDKTS